MFRKNRSMANKIDNEFEVILYYKYIQVKDPETLMREQRVICESLNLKGRILISKEGINGTLEGTKESIANYCKDLSSRPEFSDIQFKRSAGNGSAFPKLAVKVRSEIVTSGGGVIDEIDKRITGKYLKPEELKTWIESGKEFYIIDMRNDYEQRSGYFKNSILSNVANFRDIPKFIPKISHLKEKEILTVCTGGVRCEKASGMLIENGFSNVYQLEGGIHTYMEKYPNEDFKGKLYVFDGRVLVGFNTDDPKHEVVSVCENCESESENYINCANNLCHRHFILCKDCISKSGAFCPSLGGFKCRLKSGRFTSAVLRLFKWQIIK